MNRLAIALNLLQELYDLIYESLPEYEFDSDHDQVMLDEEGEGTCYDAELLKDCLWDTEYHQIFKDDWTGDLVVIDHESPRETYYCQICGIYHSVDEKKPHETDDGFVCDTDDYRYCEHCEVFHHIDDSIYVEHYGYTCELDPKIGQCYDSGDWFLTEELTTVILSQSGSTETVSDRYLCGGDYFYCDECDNWFHQDNYGGSDDYGTRCDECYDSLIPDSVKIENYSYSVEKYLDFGEKDHIYGYCGIELELGFQSDDYDDFDDLCTDIEDFAVLKEDSSIEKSDNGYTYCFGAELVTRPDIMAKHKEDLWAFLADYKDSLYVNKSMGLHVHYSKDIMTAGEIERLECFCIEKLHSSLYNQFGGRKLNTYSTKQKKVRGLLNINPQNTIEFRFCAATTDPVELAIRLEFTQALREYGIKKYTNWQGLVDYVYHRPVRFFNLVKKLEKTNNKPSHTQTVLPLFRGGLTA